MSSSIQTTNACGLCGRDPAAGFAMHGDTRYCHGDFAYPTCYMVESWTRSAAVRMFRPEVEVSLRALAREQSATEAALKRPTPKEDVGTSFDSLASEATLSGRLGDDE